MHRLKPDVDVVLGILETAVLARPNAPFLSSLLQQYRERGGLSKKQLQGLHSKCLKISEISETKLATLEAIILRKPTRYRSKEIQLPTEETQDPEILHRLEAMLAKFPGHKRLLFYKSRLAHGEPLTPADLSEIQKFEKLLNK